MRQGLLNKKIPTVFALVLLIGGIGLSIFFLNNTTSLVGRASIQDEPKNIRISNITGDSFDVTYTTDGNVLGVVTYGTDPENLTGVTTTDSSTIHQITVQNLSENTTYYFSITSGTTEYLNDGEPFQAKTGATLPPLQDTSVVKGIIINTDGSPAGGVLMYLTTSGASILSTKTSNQGEFSFAASSLRTSDLSSYLTIPPNQPLNLIGVNNSEEASAVFFLSEANPLPDISLSQTYNFTASSETPVQSDQSANFPILSTQTSQEISIVSPESDEKFSDQRPEFDGTALPGAEVEIIIQSSHEILETVQADSSGNWSFRPSEALEPGEHTITVRSRDQNGILRILTRQFTVFAEGSQFVEPSVSPSIASSSPSPTKANESPTPTNSPSPTILIPEGVSTTPTFTPTPTEIPTATLTPRPTVAPTGSNSQSILAIMSFGVFVAGMLVVVLAKIKSL